MSQCMITLGTLFVLLVVDCSIWMILTKLTCLVMKIKYISHWMDEVRVESRLSYRYIASKCGFSVNFSFFKRPKKALNFST